VVFLLFRLCCYRNKW